MSRGSFCLAASAIAASLALAPSLRAQTVTGQTQTPPPAAAPASAPAAAPAVTPTPSPALTDTEPAPRVIEIEGLAVQPGGLTAEQVARRALSASATVREKRAELDAANARIRQTIAQFIPRVVARAAYTHTSEVQVPAAFGTAFRYLQDNYLFNASLVVPISDYLLRLSDAADSAHESEAAARYARDAEVRKVLSDARILYYNWLRAHAQLSIAQNALARSRAALQDAQSAYEVGRIAHADLARIEALVANSELAVQQTDAILLLIGAQLAIVMEDKGGGDYRVGESVPLLPPMPQAERSEAFKLIANALTNRLELKAIDAQHNALQHGEEAVRADAWPRLDGIGDFAYGNPNPRFFPPTREWNESWSVGVALSMNLDQPFMADARGDELAAQAESVLARRRGVEAMVVNEVVTAQIDISKAIAALHASEISTRAAEESYRVKTDLFRVGRATTTDVIDAESELLAAKLATTNAQIDLVIGAQRLQYAVGGDVSVQK